MPSEEEKTAAFSPPTRQCSVRHVVYKNFLEPICDGCLLEELGLRPELGPILGGRDRKEGLHGEEWLLESNVEIEIEEVAPEQNKDAEVKGHYEDKDGDEADDESDFRGRSERRRGMDLSREALRISSGLPLEEKKSLASFRDELRGAESDGATVAKAVIQTEKGNAAEHPRLRSSWSQYLKAGLPPRKKKTTGVRMNGSVGAKTLSELPLQPRVWVSDSMCASGAKLPGEDDLIGASGPWPVASGAGAVDDTTRESTWEEHLRADLEEKNRTRKELFHLTPPQQTNAPRTVSSTPSSPQTASPLNIPSSEFDSTLSLKSQESIASYSHHVHSTSIGSVSSFRTAHSTPSRPSTSTTRPTTAETAHAAHPALSIHPLTTALVISTPTRPSLAQRSSSLFSPPASSPLLHSTPPLHHSPTSAFVCIHERWEFTSCGCSATKVVSCVCDEDDDDSNYVRREDHTGNSKVNRFEDDHKDGYGDGEDDMRICKAANPVVRTRWFFNPVCAECLAPPLETEGGDGLAQAGEARIMNE